MFKDLKVKNAGDGRHRLSQYAIEIEAVLVGGLL